jgi:hypothetical protein
MAIEELKPSKELESKKPSLTTKVKTEKWTTTLCESTI